MLNLLRKTPDKPWDWSGLYLNGNPWVRKFVEANWKPYRVSDFSLEDLDLQSRVYRFAWLKHPCMRATLREHAQELIAQSDLTNATLADLEDVFDNLEETNFLISRPMRFIMGLSRNITLEWEHMRFIERVLDSEVIHFPRATHLVGDLEDFVHRVTGNLEEVHAQLENPWPFHRCDTHLGMEFWQRKSRFGEVSPDDVLKELDAPWDYGALSWNPVFTKSPERFLKQRPPEEIPKLGDAYICNWCDDDE